MAAPFKLRSGNTSAFKNMGSSPVKQLGFIKHVVKAGIKYGKKAYNAIKGTSKPKYKTMGYSPNPKTYDKLNRYNPPVTGKINYSPYPTSGVKPGNFSVNVREVTKGGKTTLMPGVNANSNRKTVDKVVNDMNIKIKKYPEFLNVVKDKYGNVVKR
jgi:hypothetical protein